MYKIQSNYGIRITFLVLLDIVSLALAELLSLFVRYELEYAVIPKSTMEMIFSHALLGSGKRSRFYLLQALQQALGICESGRGSQNSLCLTAVFSCSFRNSKD